MKSKQYQENAEPDLGSRLRITETPPAEPTIMSGNIAVYVKDFGERNRTAAADSQASAAANGWDRERTSIAETPSV